MSVNYGEIICNAVDEIVTARLAGLQYDITKLCSIVDDSMAYQGKYVISDGTARYEAFTNDTSLKTGNQVQVLIPNGDYSMQKTIIGRIATTDTTPFNYVSPLDTMIKITNNIFDNARTVYGNNSGLLANGKKVLIGPIYSLEGRNSLDGYTRLGLSANFRSWLEGLDVVSGSYGIKVLIYTNQVQQAGENAENIIYELNFDSTDMVGNPYQFEDYFYQEKCFDISNISNIDKVEVYFYQNANFLDGTGNLVPHQMEDGITSDKKILIDKANNLFVKDVKIYLGYEIGAFTDETLILHTSNSLTYRYDKEEVKEINLRWIHKIDEKNFEILNKDTFNSDLYEIHWFRYNPQCEVINQYAGKDWEELDNNNEFYYYFVPDVKNQTEYIKVISLIKGITTEEGIETATPYFSNVLTFENEVLVPDQTTLKASTALSIYCLDNSEGNYLLYDQNGKIINEGAGKGKTRYLEAMFQGASFSKDLGTVNWIKWYFPIDNSSMIITTEDLYTENSGEVTERVYSYKGVNYIEITREGGSSIPNMKQGYAIDNYWSSAKSNNTVLCRANINGVEYEALEELHFGKAGSNGTNMTFYLEFAGNDNALVANNNKDEKNTAVVQARLYSDSSENTLGFPEGTTIKWEWYKKSETEYISFPKEETGTSIILTCNTDEIPMDNYFVLKGTVVIGSSTLEAYLPIPIKKAGCSYIEGAKEIIYDFQGNPSYYNQPYVAYSQKRDSTYQALSSQTWNIYYENKDKLNDDYFPSLKELSSGRKALVAPLFFLEDGNDKVCVQCYQIWSQPILVMQSRYDLAMLNEWNGTLEIDSDKGTILSTMLGAGRKDSDNTFSGVLIGDVKTGTDNEGFETHTGVYGIGKGVIAYALKDDGTATFGANGKGQIKIDGDGGTIKSASYDSEIGTGMAIDLDDGLLVVQKENKKIISLGTSKEDEGYNYFQINNIDGDALIDIGDENYLIQSSDQKMQIDLESGLIKIRGDIFNDEGTIELTPASDKYLFKINDGSSDLILMGKENYFLQSSGFSGVKRVTKTIANELYYAYNNPNVEFQISDDTVIKNSNSQYKIVYYNSSTKKVYDNQSSPKEIEFTQITTSFTDASGSNTKIVISADQIKENFLNTLTPTMEDVQPSGLKIDLKNGTLSGYNLFLSGVNSSDSSKRLIIDTSAEQVPFSIGDKFKVGWDGALTCLKLNQLVSSGASGTVININNNFKVSASGGASTSSLSTGALSVGGYGYTPQKISSYYVLAQ